MNDDRIREIAEGLLASDFPSRRAKFDALAGDDRDAVVAYIEMHYAPYRAWLEDPPPQTGN
jgi:hypothetical protein